MLVRNLGNDFVYSSLEVTKFLSQEHTFTITRSFIASHKDYYNNLKIGQSESVVKKL